jgi:hypothetical protein
MPAISSFRAVKLLTLFLMLVMTAGIVLLTIQLHFMHVHLSDFSNSIDNYIVIQQQQHRSDSGKGIRKSGTTSRTAVVDDEVEPLLNILRQGGYAEDVFDTKTLAGLPKWSTILKAYGPPKIIGLDTCERYRNSVTPASRNLGVAGTFNSGTNLLHSLLEDNCVEGDEPFAGVHWQVRLHASLL